MATTAEKFDALGYLLIGTIVIGALAYLGSPLWAQVLQVSTIGITPGTMGAAMTSKTQWIILGYYSFLVACEIALCARTGFIVFSRVDYETGGYDL
jgi:membrane glycosyltransferase